MNDSIRLGRVLGIPVGVHWGALVIAIVFAASLATSALVTFNPEASLTLRLLVASFGVVVFFASILAHEFGHAIVALRHGIEVSGITLWVLGGMAKLETQPASARSEFQIAVAGPAVSLGLGVFFGSSAVITAAVTSSRLALAVVAWLGGVNLLLAVFNMLPAAPLDGGRVLTAALWKRLGDPDRARIISGRAGLFLSAALLLIGAALIVTSSLVNGLVNIALGAMVYFAATSQISTSALRLRLATKTVAELHTPFPSAVADSTTVSQLRAWVAPEGESTAYPVTRWDNTPVGYVVPAWSSSLAPAEQSWTRVNEIMITPEQVGVATTSDPIADVVARLTGETAVIVTHDENGRGPVGTLTERQVKPLMASPTLWGKDRTPPGEPAKPRRWRHSAATTATD